MTKRRVIRFHGRSRSHGHCKHETRGDLRVGLSAMDFVMGLMKHPGRHPRAGKCFDRRKCFDRFPALPDARECKIL